MNAGRRLIVTADDFGIGPGVSQGILDLAAKGRLTWTVLLVNSPHAADAVRAWRRAGEIPPLGWHPTLTLDAPILPPSQVPTLVRPNGTFWSLPTFLLQLVRGRIRPTEIRAELHAQYNRFLELVGQLPPVVNMHHHLHIFPPVGALLRGVLASQSPRPYLRRVVEPWRTFGRVTQSLLGGLLLAGYGRSSALDQARSGFPGNVGLTPVNVLRCPGELVEMVCHPGHPDATLTGRDSLYSAARVRDYRLLADDDFPAACRNAGFALVRPDGPRPAQLFESRHAA